MAISPYLTTTDFESIAVESSTVYESYAIHVFVNTSVESLPT